jgi:hypothetical protein
MALTLVFVLIRRSLAVEDEYIRDQFIISRGNAVYLECAGLHFQSDTQLKWMKKEGSMPKNHHFEGTYRKMIKVTSHLIS